jgi:hypothetical protein
MSTARIRAWLLGRPEPRQPLRRITSLILLVVTITFASAVVGLPPSFRVAVLRVLWLLMLALAAAIVALLAHAWRRGRKTRGRRQRRRASTTP